MPLLGSPALTFDEVDDLLYFTRVNESEDLNETIAELTQKYNCSQRDVIEGAVDPNSGNTLLHYCSANGFPDLLKMLLTVCVPESTNGKQAERSIVNATNKEGNTPLHWAAYNGQLEVVKSLVDAGADIWIKNSAGHLAMFEAERAEKSDVVQYLLQAGGDSVDRAAAQASTEVDVEETQNDDLESGNASADVSMSETRQDG